MSSATVEALLAHHPIISDQISAGSLGVVLRELQRVLDQKTDGDIVEFGCYIGTTSLFLRRLLDADTAVRQRKLHVYDSFAGLPAKAAADQSSAGNDFQAGALSTSKKQLLHEFQKARLTAPIVHKGWFDELSAHDVPWSIAFAFLDGDFYESILDSLRLVWPRLSPGGIITIDDYQREALPGVERAVQVFFQGRPPTVRKEQSIGIIKKPAAS